MNDTLLAAALFISISSSFLLESVAGGFFIFGCFCAFGYLIDHLNG